MSANLNCINDAPLFAPCPSPLSHVCGSPTPPHNKVVPETPTLSAALVWPVIVPLENQVHMQEGTPEPEMVPIATGRRRGQFLDPSTCTSLQEMKYAFKPKDDGGSRSPRVSTASNTGDNLLE